MSKYSGHLYSLIFVFARYDACDALIAKSVLDLVDGGSRMIDFFIMCLYGTVSICFEAL